MDDGISEKNGVGFEDGLLDAIAVGGSDAGETFVPSSPSVGMGWRLAPEVGPEGINVEGRSIGVTPESPNDPPGLLSYVPLLPPTFAFTVVPVSL